MLLHFTASPPLFPAKNPSFLRRLSPPRRRNVHITLPPSAISVDGGGEDAFSKYSGYIFQDGESREAELLNEYDIQKIGRIYGQKPTLVIRRLVQIGLKFGWFGANRYLDVVFDRADETFEIRAAELRMMLLELGPAFVKVAQAVSSRPDVIPPTYLNELSLLQDRIAPFSSEVAFNMIEKELGSPLEAIFSDISPEPIAAASLGQVYKARLRSNGKTVAVKVQRPGVQAAISLDIFILRFLAGLLRKAAKVNTDLQAVIDEWASSLFRVITFNAGDGLPRRSKKRAQVQETLWWLAGCIYP